MRPGKRPARTAGTGKALQLHEEGEGVDEATGFARVLVVSGRLEVVGSDDVADEVDVDGSCDDDDDDDGCMKFWSVFITHVSVLLSHVYPNGQHLSVPHDGKTPSRLVVLMVDFGWSSTFCWSRSQMMGLMREQSVPAGQQRIVVFEARVTQDVVSGQQKLSGRPDEGQELKDDGHDEEEDCRGKRAAMKELGCAAVAAVVFTRSEKAAAAIMAIGLRSCFRIAA